MVAILDWMQTLLDADRVTAMAERVAGRSRMGLWQRTMHRLPSLGPSEARGYLRARGIAIVREELQNLIEQEGPAIRRHQATIEEAAMQLLIEMISAQLAQGRAARRRAA
jgi:hypothetical protein